MFILRSGSYTIILLLYVDDIVLIRSSPSIHSFVGFLSHQFTLKNLGDVHYFLGVHITRSLTGLFLSQFKSTYDLIRKFHMQTCNLVHTRSTARTTLSISHG